MNTPCSPYLANGADTACGIPLSQVDNIIVVDRTVTFASLSEVQNVVKWKSLVNIDLTAYIAGTVNSYAPSTDDPNIVTAENTTEKTITNNPIPSAVFYLGSNHCDYMEMAKNIVGGLYGIIYVLKNGNKVLLEQLSDGTYSPFFAKTTAMANMPLVDVLINFPLYVNHNSYDQFVNAKVIPTPFNISTTLQKAMPVGAEMSIITPYVVGTGIVRVQLNDRCSATTIDDAVLADFFILDSNNLNTPAVIAVTPVAGIAYQYDVELNKEVVPTPMTAGDFMELVYKKVTATVVSKISNRLFVLAE